MYKRKYRIDSIRLKGWDYASPGNYFITICTKDKGNIFGKIASNGMVLNKRGEIAQKFAKDIPNHFKNVVLHTFAIMPDHVHILLEKMKCHDGETEHCSVCANDHDICRCNENKSHTFYYLTSESIPVIVRSYKSICSRTIHEMEKNKNFKWQRSYHDQILFDEQYLQNVESYIKSNHKKHMSK